jgi:hypothetical protein
MIFVAHETVLTRRADVVTGLAETLFHLTEIRSEFLRIALLVALQIGAALFEAVAGQTTVILQDADALTDPDRLEMRLMDEIGEASVLALDRRRGEIDDTPFAPDIVNAGTLQPRRNPVAHEEKQFSQMIDLRSFEFPFLPTWYTRRYPALRSSDISTPRRRHCEAFSKQRGRRKE